MDGTQAKLLKSIYNSYYNSPIQLRDEIAEHNNVAWVRAFRFIFNLWESYLNGSFIDLIQALKLYATIDVRKITPKSIFQIRRISDNVFSEVNDYSYTCEIIKKFNTEVVKPELMKENPADEFTRMYYVACSRTKEDLYIHISDEHLIPEIQASINAYIEKSKTTIAYEFIQ